MNSAAEILSQDDQKFLVELLLKQQYALELVSSEIMKLKTAQNSPIMQLIKN